MHEIRHGIGVVCISKSHVHVYLGSRNEGNKENLKLGRHHLHVHIGPTPDMQYGMEI